MQNKIDFLKEFAASLDCTFVEKGEVGFGRPCVGILDETAGCYLNINPKEYDDDFYLVEVVGYSHELRPPETVSDAYHKHSCLCVLAHNDDYDEAISQIYDWVKSILSHGEVELYKWNFVDVDSIEDAIEKIFANPYNVALVYKNRSAWC